MQKLYFWNSWPKAQKISFYLAASMFILALLLYTVSFWLGESLMLVWKTQGTIEPVQVNLTWIEKYLLEAPLIIDSFRVTEQFYAERLALNINYSYIFLGCFAISWITLLAISTQLSRWWYFIATSMVMLVLIGFRMENLSFMGLYNHTLLIISFVIFIPASYLFHAFKTNTSFLIRWLSFALLTLALGLLIYFFAEASLPYARLIHYGFLSPLILSVVFIFLIAHDIPAAFLNLLTNSSSGNEGTNLGGYLTHFLVFTSVYLLNLLLAYFQISGRIDWGIGFIHPYIILPVSAIVGLWMMRQRSEAMHTNILPYNKSGALLYLIMAFNCFATIGYFNITANDPLVESLEDMVLFSHLGVGLIFITYVLANFFGMMIKGQATHRILYKPLNMPYFTARLGGTIAAAAFFFFSGMAPFLQATGGFYNSIADLYAIDNDDFVAEEYYKLGSQYGYNNHRSNYALYSLANKANDTYASSYYLTKALEKNPTPHAYANLALEYEKSDKIFDAIFTLRNGMKAFPDNGYLANNLGLLFAKTDLGDSAYHYFMASAFESDTRDAANTNILALKADREIPLTIDSLIQNLNKDYLPTLVNLQHLGNLKLYQADLNLDTTSTQLNAYSFAFQYNQSLNRFYNQDASANQWLIKLKNDSANLAFRNSLELAHILNLYQSGNTSESIRLLGDARYASRQFAAYYSYLMGIEALSYGSKDFAGFNLEFANSSNEKEAQWALMMLRLSEGYTEDAYSIIQTIKQNKLYPDRASIVQSLERAITSPISYTDSLLDIEKYWVLAFRTAELSHLEAISLIDKIKISELQFKASGTYADYLMDNLRYKEVGELLKEIELTSNATMQVQLNELKLRYSLLTEQKSEVIKLANLSNKSAKPIYLWANAQIAHWNNDSTLASKLYNQLGKNILYEEGLFASARYFQAINNQDLAYHILVEATRINPFSINIKKAYGLQALRYGMESYGHEVLAELKKLMKPDDFSFYSIEFNTLKQTEKQRSAEWN